MCYSDPWCYDSNEGIPIPTQPSMDASQNNDTVHANEAAQAHTGAHQQRINIAAACGSAAAAVLSSQR